MPKKLENEDQVWMLAYSIAMATLTLGAAMSPDTSTHAQFINFVDKRARALADQVLATLREKEII